MFNVQGKRYAEDNASVDLAERGRSRLRGPELNRRAAAAATAGVERARARPALGLAGRCGDASRPRRERRALARPGDPLRDRRGAHRVPADQLDRPPPGARARARRRAARRERRMRSSPTRSRSRPARSSRCSGSTGTGSRRWSKGVTGRSADGRRVLIAVAIAFVPAALVGVILESAIKDVLFGVGPVIGAWFVGGILILVLTRAGVLVTARRSRAGDAHAARRARHRAGAGRRAVAGNEPQPRDDRRRAAARLLDGRGRRVQLPARLRDPRRGDRRTRC